TRCFSGPAKTEVRCSMLSRAAFVVGIVLVCAGVGRADEVTGVIYKIDPDKLVFRKQGAEDKTYDLAKDVKVFRIIRKDKWELDADGLKAEPLPNLPKG